MNFTSQICTTREQSERLLALGLKKETADCSWNTVTLHGTPITYPSQDSWLDSSIISDNHFPAWSLHRLMCLCPTEINGYDFYVSHDYVYYLDIITDYNDDKLVGFPKDNPFDSLIDCIEWLIKEGYFNREYLEE